LTAEPGGEPRVTRRTVIAGTLVGVPISAFLLWLATRRIDTGRLGDTLAGAEPLGVLAALIILMPVYGLVAERWRLVSGEPSLPRRAFLGLVLASAAANNVIPGRPGEALRGLWLARLARIPAGRAFATVVIDRSADVAVLVAMVTACAFLVEEARWLRLLVAGGLGIAVLLAGALLGARWYALRSARGRRREGGAVVERSRLGRLASTFVRGLATSLPRRRLAPVALISLTTWAAWSCGAWTVAASLDIRLSPVEAILLTGVLNLGIAIPSSPGFIGTYQWLSVAALGLFGVGATEAVAFSVLMQGLWLVPSTLGGLVAAGALALSLRPKPAAATGPARPHALEHEPAAPVGPSEMRADA
jgi:uncharacterized protein (TIRG00374 family)